jgi:hypothetical protein
VIKVSARKHQTKNLNKGIEMKLYLFDTNERKGGCFDSLSDLEDYLGIEKRLTIVDHLIVVAGGDMVPIGCLC